MLIKSELLLQEQNKVAASRILRQSLAEAQSPEELAWELRTSMSLAHPLREEKLDRTTSQLQFPLYGRFTQGFMTADLVEAKRLPDELDQVCSDGPRDLPHSVRANKALSSTGLDIRYASQLGRSIISPRAPASDRHQDYGAPLRDGDRTTTSAGEIEGGHELQADSD